MEAKGAVNQYDVYREGRFAAEGGKTVYKPAPKATLAVFPPIFTVNLAAGTTPFIRFFEGVKYSSQCYRLTWQPVVVTYANYRPGAEAFKELTEFEQDHVLNGGLLCGKLGEVTTLKDDPVEPSWDYERFQRWCLGKYGKRRPPMEEPPGTGGR